MVLILFLVLACTGVTADEPFVLDRDGAISRSIERNQQLREIQAKSKITGYAVIEQFRNLFPSLTLSLLQMDQVNEREADSREKKITVSSEVTVFDGGEKKLNYEISRYQALLARNDYRIALNQIIYQTEAAYLDLLKNRKAIEIYDKSVVVAREQLLYANKEVELGDATELSRTEVEAQVVQLEYNLKEAQEQYNLSLNRIKILTRIDWKEPLIVKGSIDEYVVCKIPEQNVDELVAVALEKRKEVESAKLDYEISKRQNAIAERYYIPKIAVGGNYTLSGEEYFPRERSWGVSLKLSMQAFGNSANSESRYDSQANDNGRIYTQSGGVNILDSLSYKRTLAETRMKVESAGVARATTRQEMAVSIDAAYQSVLNLWRMIELSDIQIRKYEKIMQIEKMKVDLGETRRHDYLEKEIEKDKAIMSYLSSKTDYISKVSELELALGENIGFLEIISYTPHNTVVAIDE